MFVAATIPVHRTSARLRARLRLTAGFIRPRFRVSRHTNTASVPANAGFYHNRTRKESPSRSLLDHARAGLRYLLILVGAHAARADRADELGAAHDRDAAGEGDAVGHFLDGPRLELHAVRRRVQLARHHGGSL